MLGLATPQVDGVAITLFFYVSEEVARVGPTIEVTSVMIFLGRLQQERVDASQDAIKGQHCTLIIYTRESCISWLIKLAVVEALVELIKLP